MNSPFSIFSGSDAAASASATGSSSVSGKGASAPSKDSGLGDYPYPGLYSRTNSVLVGPVVGVVLAKTNLAVVVGELLVH